MKRIHFSVSLGRGALASGRTVRDLKSTRSGRAAGALRSHFLRTCAGSTLRCQERVPAESHASRCRVPLIILQQTSKSHHQNAHFTRTEVSTHFVVSLMFLVKCKYAQCLQARILFYLSDQLRCPESMCDLPFRSPDETIT